MVRHASDRGASSPHLGRRRARGGDTRRRAAPLSNPRPAQPAPLTIRPIARRNKLEPQSPAGGRRAHARASALLAAALRARQCAIDCGARRPPPACAMHRAAPCRRPRRPRRLLAAPLAASARRGAGCRRSSRYVVGRRMASGGAVPAVVRAVRVARRPRWRTPLVALRRPPARLGWRPRGRKPERLCVQLLLPRLPGQRPVGFERARPAARGCGRVTLVAAAPPAALLGASRRCPPCRSRRVLRRRLWLRLVLRPGAACRAGLASVPRFGRAAGGWRVCLCVWSGVARSHAGLTLD